MFLYSPVFWKFDPLRSVHSFIPAIDKLSFVMFILFQLSSQAMMILQWSHRQRWAIVRVKMHTFLQPKTWSKLRWAQELFTVMVRSYIWNTVQICVSLKFFFLHSAHCSALPDSAFVAFRHVWPCTVFTFRWCVLFLGSLMLLVQDIADVICSDAKKCGGAWYHSPLKDNKGSFLNATGIFGVPYIKLQRRFLM